MSICSKEKKDLIEEIGASFEEKHSLTPLAARIFAMLILSKDDGYSFDDIITITQASKSSVSTNINLLSQLNYIEHYTKTGERKRYFKTSKSNAIITMEENLKSIKKELRLIEKINTFNRCNNLEKFKRNESVGEIFQHYLKSQKKNLKSTIASLKQKKPTLNSKEDNE